MRKYATLTLTLSLQGRGESADDRTLATPGGPAQSDRTVCVIGASRETFGRNASAVGRPSHNRGETFRSYTDLVGAMAA